MSRSRLEARFVLIVSAISAVAFQHAFARNSAGNSRRNFAGSAVNATPLAAQPRFGSQSPDVGSAWSRPSRINLLKLVNIKRDTVRGKWFFRDGALLCRAHRLDRIVFRYKPPAQYNFRITFSRLRGNDSITMFCTAASHEFDWDMGGWGNAFDGFEEVNGHDANANPTTRRFARCLENGRRYICLVKVRANGVRAYLNGRLISKWMTNYHDMTVRGVWGLPRNEVLGLAVQRSPTIFYSAEVTPINNTASPLLNPTYNPFPSGDGSPINPLLSKHEKNPGEFTLPTPRPAEKFTSALAIAARQRDHQAVQAALKRCKSRIASATANCKTLLQAALHRVMTSENPAETRRLLIMVTALKNPAFDAPSSAGFTDPRARIVWKKYIIALAEASGDYLARLHNIRRQYAGDLRKAMAAAVDDNDLAEALRIHALLERLHRMNANPLHQR
jgi:hypothetical protein